MPSSRIVSDAFCRVVIAITGRYQTVYPKSEKFVYRQSVVVAGLLISTPKAFTTSLIRARLAVA